MAIIGGGAKQDEAPVGHAAAAPRHYKVNMWRDHGRRVHLAVAESLAVPPKNEEK